MSFLCLTYGSCEVPQQSFFLICYYKLVITYNKLETQNTRRAWPFPTSVLTLYTRTYQIQFFTAKLVLSCLYLPVEELFICFLQNSLYS
jgi:hypothetical protein